MKHATKSYVIDVIALLIIFLYVYHPNVAFALMCAVVGYLSGAYAVVPDGKK